MDECVLAQYLWIIGAQCVQVRLTKRTNTRKAISIALVSCTVSDGRTFVCQALSETVYFFIDSDVLHKPVPACADLLLFMLAYTSRLAIRTSISVIHRLLPCSAEIRIFIGNIHGAIVNYLPNYLTASLRSLSVKRRAMQTDAQPRRSTHSAPI